MTRTKKFFYNSLSTVFLQIITMLVGFILPRVMLKYYGSEINGLVTSITQFISYFNLVEAGLASAATYALYKPLADKDEEKISEVVSTSKKFYYISGYIFTFLVLGLAVTYPLLIKTNLFSYSELFILIIILGSSGFLDFFTLAKYRVLLTADQKVYMISVSSIIYYILNTIIIIIFAKIGMSIIIARFFALFSIVIRSVILYVYVHKHYKYINYHKKTNKKLIDKRWDALYLQMLGSIQNGAPVIILTIFSNLVTVSIFSIYNMVMQGINSILSIFINGLSSSFGEIIVKKEEKTLQKTTQEFEYLYYNIITLVYSISLVLIMPFVKIYTSGINDNNYYYPILGVLFVMNGLLYNIKTPQGMLVISAGMYKETRTQTTIQGLIIVILGVILTPKLGIVGILIASICANIYRDIDLLFFIPKNLTKLSIMCTLKRQVKIFILGAIIYCICICLPISINGYLSWIVHGVVSAFIGLIVILIFDIIFEKKQLKSIITRLKMIVGVK